MLKESKKHLISVNQTYLEHFYLSMSCSLYSLLCFFIMFSHAICPGIFQKTGGDYIIILYKKIKKQRS